MKINLRFTILLCCSVLYTLIGVLKAESPPSIRFEKPTPGWPKEPIAISDSAHLFGVFYSEPTRYAPIVFSKVLHVNASVLLTQKFLQNCTQKCGT